MFDISLKTSNEILAILVFMLTTWLGVFLVFGKHMRKKELQDKFYRADFGKDDSLISKIQKEENIMGFLDRLQRELNQARIKMSANSFVVLSIFSSIIVAVLGSFIFRHVVFIIAFLIIGFIIPRFYLKSRRRKFVEEFDLEMVKALRRMAAILRIGGTLDQALNDVINSNNISEIVKYEFGKVYAAFKAGFSINEAFYELYKSIGSKDTLYLCVSIDIQMETGGDKAEIIEDIANSITEKNLKQRRVKSKLAEIDISVKFMAAMPLVFGALITLINPDHFNYFTSSFKGQLLGFGMTSFIIGGYFIMKRMSRIEM